MAETFRYSRYAARRDTAPATAFPRGHVNHLPLVDLKLRIGSSTTPLLKVLVDSGSAYCVFGLDAAKTLGINVQSGNLRAGIRGVGGGTVDLYFFNIELVIDSITLDCYAGFMNHDFPGNNIWMGLLGEYDFFTKLPVAFDVGKLQIRIG